MNLFVNGCSHTQGTDVSLPEIRDGYPHVIEREYGILTRTKAQCGSSNDRIVRSTIAHIVENPNYTHAVIQWTSQDRFESPANPVSASEIDRCFDGFYQHYPLSDTKRGNLGKHVTRFYENFYNQDDKSVRHKGHNKMYTQMLGLNSFLESYDIIPIHFTYNAAGGGKDNKLKKVVKSQLNFLCDPELGMENLLLSHGYKYCGKQRLDGLGPDLHFMKDAHMKMAEWIYEYLTSREQIKTPEEVITWQQATDPSNHVYNMEDL